ncbi:menaquinone biosynthesis protein [Leptospira ryugenii]|uniref:1,4-dihydroxy-6-naphtoate synthase n=1 Tax=Leptospira ryugenii TaxID=1917863 RepID=A0A2P2E4Z0_9LEPT|nr:1,4-dihydroxy-6-naphthoate synthase [Leptospira ryugenii]GBF51926.1 menaquinone biosynthesis protein [Leptospira ryugenii]
MISIAYSPCPNDTFLFYHLVHKKIKGYESISEELWDVENLNQFAREGKFPVTKISFAAYFTVIDRYVLLETGSALGKGCGPILVRKKGSHANLTAQSRIVVPGLLTTANLLLSLYTESNFEAIPTRYDKIIPSLLSGEEDFGVIIHEERFTFESRGLEKVVDLGQWWEDNTGLMIPLGAIAIRRDIPRSDAIHFQRGLQESLKQAYLHPDLMKSYIQEHSQNKDPQVIQSHIDLYVNEYTKKLGTEGHKAIESLYNKALQIGFAGVQNSNLPLFLGEAE